MKRFARLRLGFSKKLEKLNATVALHMAHYSFLPGPFHDPKDPGNGGPSDERCLDRWRLGRESDGVRMMATAKPLMQEHPKNITERGEHEKSQHQENNPPSNSVRTELCLVGDFRCFKRSAVHALILPQEISNDSTTRQRVVF
jgi:hypothetical protein